MKHPFAYQLEELETMFGGRHALIEVCGVTKTSISTWKQTGIPDNQRFKIAVAAVERGIDLPDWYFRNHVNLRRKPDSVSV